MTHLNPILTLLITYLVFSFIIKMVFKIDTFKIFKYIFSIFRSIISIIWSTILFVSYVVDSIFRLFSRFFFGSENKFHSASWMSGWNRRKILHPDNDGLILEAHNRISKELSMTHCLCYSPTGGGKSTAYCIPNLLTLSQRKNSKNKNSKWSKGASIVISDPSGTIYRKTEKYLRSQRINVQVFDVENISARYNRLQNIESFSEYHQIATILVDASNPDFKGDSFWLDNAKSIISLTIRALKNRYEILKEIEENKEDSEIIVEVEEVNLKMIYRYLTYFNTDKQEFVDKEFAKYLDADGFQEFKSIMGNDSKLLGSMITSARTSLSKLSDPHIADLTSTNTLDFTALRNEPTAIFFIVPEKLVSYNQYLTTLVFDDLFSFLSKNKKELNNDSDNFLPVYCILDEFANIGKLPDFGSVISQIRKYDVSISIIIQDIKQLVDLYGSSVCSVILSNTINHIFFAGLNLETTRNISAVLGSVRKTVEDENGIKKEVIYPLLHSDEIRMLPQNRAIFISGNKRPIMLKLKRYYQHSRYKKMLKG